MTHEAHRWPRGRPRKQRPVEERVRRRKRDPDEIDSLLSHCRERPGTWVLLEVMPTMVEAKTRAANYRRRERNGPGVWQFRSAMRDELGPGDFRQYGVYGMWRNNGRVEHGK